MDNYRTFIAIELPRELRFSIVEHIDRLRREMPDARASWGREENLHLTLKFLGNVPAADIPKVSDAAERAAKTVGPFALTLSGCGTFPPRDRPSVLWIGIDTQASGLLELHAALENELAAAGFPPEARPFHPHLTIARLRKPQGARRLAELHQSLGFAPQAFTVSELVVFKSELLRDGSKHTAISGHQLG